MANSTSEGTSEVRVEHCSDDLITVTLDDTRRCRALAEHLRITGDWIESVPGLASCTVQFDPLHVEPDVAFARVEAALASLPRATESTRQHFVLPVIFGGEDGPDLESVCATLGMSEHEFVAAVTGEKFEIEMLGFTPGFAYVGGVELVTEIGRLGDPRLEVRPGSIGVTAGRAGIYALPGPGGWPLVGRTTATLFDASRDEPFVLEAGATVEFQALAVAPHRGPSSAS